MGYADLDEAARRLNLTEAHVEEEANLALLDAALSALFDRAVERTFDGSALSLERTIEAPYVSDILLLPVPVRTITSVIWGGTWNGVTWDDGTTLAVDAYRPIFGSSATGYRGLHLPYGTYWTGPVRVTGTWGDDPGDGTAPAAVVDLLTHAVVLEFRRRGSPNGTINDLLDEGETAAPSIFRDPLWKEVTKQYRVTARGFVL